MARMLFTNVSIFDGSGSAIFPGEVLVEDRTIAAVTPGLGKLDRAGADVVDGGGVTLMPGLVEGHAHLSYPNAFDRIPPGDLTPFTLGLISAEARTLMAAHAGKVFLDSGFTSAYSAGGTTMNMEVALRDEIEAGWIPGPRLRAAGTEGVLFTGVGNPNDFVTHDVEALRQSIKDCAEAKNDIVKVILSGPDLGGPGDREPMYADHEAQAMGDQARESGIWLTAHCRPAAAVKQALKYGWRVLYHVDRVDEECLDLMQERNAEIFIGPAPGFLGKLYDHAQSDQQRAMAAAGLENYRNRVAQFRERGVRIIIGGDYGFAELPHGTNANDLDYFVRHLGLSPTQALVCATGTGGELMQMPVGRVKEGYSADLLLVDGDPTQDVRVLCDRDNLVMIMKDGKYHKAPPACMRSESLATVLV